MTKQPSALRPASRIGDNIVQKKDTDSKNTEACRIALESSRKQLAPSLPSVPPHEPTHETGQYSLCRPSIQVESMFPPVTAVGQASIILGRRLAHKAPHHGALLWCGISAAPSLAIQHLRKNGGGKAVRPAIFHPYGRDSPPYTLH